MEDKIVNKGNWAQSDVIKVLQDNGVLPSNANEGIGLVT